MRCYCPDQWTHAHSLQRAVEKGMATCVLVIGKTCQRHFWRIMKFLPVWMNTPSARGTSIVANSSLALDHDTRGGGYTMSLMRTPTSGGGMGSHPPAFGEGRWEPLPQETGLRMVRLTMLALVARLRDSAIPDGSRNRAGPVAVRS